MTGQLLSLKNLFKVSAMALSILVSGTNLKGQSQSVIRVGLHDAKPLAYRDSTGNAKGFSIEILEHIATEEDWRIEYVDGTWAEWLGQRPWKYNPAIGVKSEQVSSLRLSTL